MFRTLKEILSQTKSADRLRVEQMGVEAELPEIKREIEGLEERRSAALLDDDGEALDALDRELLSKRRALERSNLLLGELSRAVAELTFAEGIAALDESYESAVAALAEGRKGVKKYNDGAKARSRSSLSRFAAASDHRSMTSLTSSSSEKVSSSNWFPFPD